MRYWRCTGCGMPETNTGDPVTCPMCHGPMEEQLADGTPRPKFATGGVVRGPRPFVVESPPPSVLPARRIPLYRAPGGQVTPRPGPGHVLAGEQVPLFGPPHLVHIDVGPIVRSMQNMRGQISGWVAARKAQRTGEPAVFTGEAKVTDDGPDDVPTRTWPRHLSATMSRTLVVVPMPALRDAVTGGLGVTFPALPQVPPPVEDGYVES